MANFTRTLSQGAVAAPKARPGGPALFLLLEGGVPCGARVNLDGLERVCLGRGSERQASAGASPKPGNLEVVLPDPWLSTSHARLERGAGAWTIEDLGSKNGTSVNGARQRRCLLGDGDILELGRSVLLFRADASGLTAEPRSLLPSVPELATFHGGLARDLEALASAARARIPILLQGETGTGKEIVARAVHAFAGRSGPWIPVNCGALPEPLAVAELFGYRRGAFSGAVDDRHGLVRAADGGTLFLDEVGDLPPTAQVALLRTLQEGEVLALGQTRPVRVDLQVVCATHVGLQERVEQKSFRADLYGRIAGLVLTLPRLAERREDLGLIAGRVLQTAARDADPPQLSTAAMRRLLEHPWPLNIRELQRALEAANAVRQEGEIQPEHLFAGLRKGSPREGHIPRGRRPVAEDSERRSLLHRKLGEHRGNVAAVARELGKAPIQIHRWIERYGLELEGYRKGAVSKPLGLAPLT